MNVVNAVVKLRSNLMSSTKVQCLQATSRIKSLCQKELVSFQNPENREISTINMDKVECRYMLSGSTDGSIFIHDMLNSRGSFQECNYKTIGEIEIDNRHCHQGCVNCIQWYPYDTGLFLSSSSREGTDSSIKAWDANTLVPVDSLILQELTVYQHHMSPIATNHNLVAVASSAHEVYLWDIRKGARTHGLSGHASSVLSVKWSPSHEFHLASGSRDHRLTMWDIRATKSALFSMAQHNRAVVGLSFTRGGLSLLSVGMDNQMNLWNTSSGLNQMVNYGVIPVETEGALNFDVSTDTDPEIIFLPSRENIQMYELHTGKNRGTLHGHYQNVTCCIYENYQTLYSVSNEEDILVWAPDTDDD